MRDEKQHREAELQAARDKQQAAEALATAETAAKHEAQRHAAALRRRKVRGLQQLVAADALGHKEVEGGLLDAAVARRAIVRVVETTERGGTHLAFSPDRQRVVSGGHDGKVWVFDANTGQPVSQPMTGHTNEVVTSVAFSPDGKRIVSGGADKTVRVWDAASGQPIGAPLTGHTDWVWSVGFSPDGQQILSGSADKTVRVWDANTGRQIGQPLTGHTDAV